MPFLDVDGAQLYWDARGSQSPPILMMHGLGLDHTCLRPWHDPLAASARVVYYDHRGNGRSTRGDRSVDHARWHADAAALLDHLEEPRAIIYGHSYGAWLALGFALRYPERVSGLILCGASPAFDYVPEVIAEAQRRDPRAAEVMVTGLATPIETDAEFGELWHKILPLYFHGAPRPDVLANTIYGAAAFARGIELLAGFTVEDRLHTITCPILVLEGTHDYITPPSQARRIVDRAPHARMIEFPNSGHFPFVEEQDAYLQAIADWRALSSL